MYRPPMYEEKDRAKNLRLMQDYSFASVMHVLAGRIVATHLPIATEMRAGSVLCSGHFAKANPQWRALEKQETMIVFTGSHAYISPAHYDKLESVPTWNYQTVHAYGQAKIVDYQAQPEALDALLKTLIARHEPSYSTQWQGLSEKYRAGMLRGIVGFEMVVDRLEGKAKLSQNKKPVERERISKALLRSADTNAQALGKAMETEQD